MAENLFFLSETDLAKLKEIIGKVNSTLNETRKASYFDEDYPSSDIYIAKIPEGGISAPNFNLAEPTIESAECEIYNITIESDQPLVTPMESFTKDVYNLGESDLLEDQYVPIYRTWL